MITFGTADSSEFTTNIIAKFNLNSFITIKVIKHSTEKKLSIVQIINLILTDLNDT